MGMQQTNRDAMGRDRTGGSERTVHPSLRWLRWALWTLALLLPATAGAAESWESLGVIDGVKVWRKEVPDSNVFAFRGEITADVNMGKLVSVFLDKSQRKYWVDRYADSRELDPIDPMHTTYWIQFKLPPGISDRDYVLKATGESDPATGTFVAKIRSVEHPRAPVDDCCVRANVVQTYYRFEAVKGQEKVKMLVEVHTDPKGWLPGWVVNLIQKNWPSKTLNGLIRRSRAAEIHPFGDFASWHSRP
ncbi:MAG: hypothetical protein HY902_11020 [Deltaproteobacteria bacterium]|nr:hypothetical protein [Deltaproteobacteria bacterium]